MSTMNYISKSGKKFVIESMRGLVSGEHLGFYVWDEGGNLVHGPADGCAPIDPFATIDEAEAFADTQ